MLAAMRRNPRGRTPPSSGRLATATCTVLVTMKTAFGSTRIVDLLAGRSTAEDLLRS